MEVLCVNTNLYSDADLKALMIDEVQQKKEPLFVFGKKEVYEEIVINCLSEEVYYLGFSPFDEKHLESVIALYAVYKNFFNKVILKIYEGNEYTYQLELRSILNAYQNKSSEYGSFLHSIFTLPKKLESIPCKELKTGLVTLVSDIEFDNLLISMYNYQFNFCEFKNIQKGLKSSLRNESFFYKMVGIADREYKKKGKWSDLKDCMDEYQNYVRSDNERVLLFYVSLFLNISLFQKNFKKSALSYLFLLRSLEVFLVFYLKKKGYIKEESNELLFHDGTQVMGSGPLIHYMIDIQKIDKESSVLTLLSIRNNSFVGHGLYSPNLDKYDDIYNSYTKLVLELLNEDEAYFFNKCKKLFMLHSKRRFNDIIKSLFNN